MKQKAGKFSFYFAGATYLVYGILFLTLTVRLIGADSAPAFAPLSIAGILILLAIAVWMLQKHAVVISRIYRPILLIFLVVMFAVQLTLAEALRFEPDWDLEAVFAGAIQWAETGSFTDYQEYFYFFPNNLGSLTFLAVIFRIAYAVGITDYFMVAAVTNSLLACLAVLTTAAFCQRLLGAEHALFTLLLIAVYPPIWFIGPAFYTDSMSILFPVLILYLYCRVLEGNSWRRTILWAIILGAAAAAGALIKATVLIMVVAVVIDALVRHRLKLAGILAAVSALLVVAGFICLNVAVYPTHLNKETANEINTPYLHWIMMGLQGDGGYNAEDYEFSRSFPNTETRDDALREEIHRRMNELGPSGLYRLFWTKTLRTFGSGTLQQSDFLDDRPAKRTELHEYLLYDGMYYDIYRGTCSVIFTAVLVLAAISGIQEVFGRRRQTNGRVSTPLKRSSAETIIQNTWNCLAPRLALLGVVLFFAAWETSGRYITNYVPVIILCGVMGATSWQRWLVSLVRDSVFSRYRDKSCD